MLQPKKRDALVDSSIIVEMDIDRVPLNERVDNLPTVETQEVADSTSTTGLSLENL